LKISLKFINCYALFKRWTQRVKILNVMKDITITFYPGEDADYLPHASRYRRQIPRTLVSERVRSAIEEIRVRRTQRMQQLASSDEVCIIVNIIFVFILTQFCLWPSG
jgi:hypothetical protein